MNTEHQLKSKLAWSVFQRSMKLKQNGTRGMTTTKNDVFIFLLGWIDFCRGEWANFWVVGGTSPIPPVGKTLYIYIYIYIIYIYIYICYTYAYIKELFCQQFFIYNEEAPCTSHICAKGAILLLSTLCVTDIYGIYFHLSVQCL